jgi:hypothetical protein
MGKQYKKLTSEDVAFIKQQKLFYIASASNAEVNLSPKGYDSIRLLNESQLLYLDYPGSGNRTARDIKNGGDITILFNAFEGKAQILRMFCKGHIIDKEHADFAAYIDHFDVIPEAMRQLFVFDIYAVETSCGESVPYMEFKKERKTLKKWTKNLADSGKLETYITDHEVPIDLTKLAH